MKTKSNAQVVLDDLARSADVSLTSDGREALESILGSVGTFKPGAPVTAKDEDGNEVGAAEWFGARLKQYPAFIAPKPAEPAPKLPAGNATERAIAINAARKADRSAEAEALVAQHGNPFRKDRPNLTHQMFLKNVHPTLANRLSQEAGR